MLKVSIQNISRALYFDYILNIFISYKNIAEIVNVIYVLLTLRWRTKKSTFTCFYSFFWVYRLNSPVHKLYGHSFLKRLTGEKKLSYSCESMEIFRRSSLWVFKKFSFTFTSFFFSFCLILSVENEISWECKFFFLQNGYSDFNRCTMCTYCNISKAWTSIVLIKWFNLYHLYTISNDFRVSLWSNGLWNTTQLNVTLIYVEYFKIYFFFIKFMFRQKKLRTALKWNAI